MPPPVPGMPALPQVPHERQLVARQDRDVLLPILNYVQFAQANFGIRTYDELLNAAQNSTEAQMPGRGQFLNDHMALVAQYEETRREMALVSRTGNFQQANSENFRLTTWVRLCALRCDYWYLHLNQALDIGPNKAVITRNIESVLSDLLGKIVADIEELEEIYPDEEDPDDLFGPEIDLANFGQIFELHSTLWHNFARDNETPKHCYICQDNFSAKHPPFRVQKCGHIFGYTCLNHWVNGSGDVMTNTCPLDRGEICPPRQRLESDRSDDLIGQLELWFRFYSELRWLYQQCHGRAEETRHARNYALELQQKLNWRESVWDVHLCVPQFEGPPDTSLDTTNPEGRLLTLIRPLQDWEDEFHDVDDGWPGQFFEGIGEEGRRRWFVRQRDLDRSRDSDVGREEQEGEEEDHNPSPPVTEDPEQQEA